MQKRLFIISCGKPHDSLPCFGERRYGHAQDAGMAISIPADQVEKVKRNLKELGKRGIRYPIAYYGATCDVFAGTLPLYHDIVNECEQLQKKESS